MMRHRTIKGIGVPERYQGIIRYMCLCYDDLEGMGLRGVKDIICERCQEEGGLYWQALYTMVTTRRAVVEIAEEHGVSKQWLYHKRNNLYRSIYKALKK